MQNDLFQQGLSLMIYGMGTVFVFLALLVVVTYTMSAIVKRFFNHVESNPQHNVKTPKKVSSPVNDTQRVAVITAAIYKHRSITDSKDH